MYIVEVSLDVALAFGTVRANTTEEVGFFVTLMSSMLQQPRVAVVNSLAVKTVEGFHLDLSRGSFLEKIFYII